MTRKEPEIVEDENEQFEMVGIEGPKAAQLAEGCTAVIDVKGRRDRKFWENFNGQKCFIISCHRDAAIVEVASSKELLLCQIKDLRPTER
jgi:hypothetical protein